MVEFRHLSDPAPVPVGYTPQGQRRGASTSIYSGVPRRRRNAQRRRLIGGADALFELLGQRYRDAGVVDVAVTVYPGARHEILNETNGSEVTSDIVDWLSLHVAS